MDMCSFKCTLNVTNLKRSITYHLTISIHERSRIWIVTTDALRVLKIGRAEGPTWLLNFHCKRIYVGLNNNYMRWLLLMYYQGNYDTIPLLLRVGSVSSSRMCKWCLNQFCTRACLLWVQFHTAPSTHRHCERNTAMVGTCCHLLNAPRSNSQVLEKLQTSLWRMPLDRPEKKEIN